MGFKQELMTEVHELLRNERLAPDDALFRVLQKWHRRGWQTLEGDRTPTGLPSYASMVHRHSA